MPMPSFRKAADVQQPADEAPKPAERKPQAGPVRTNGYGAKCVACGGWVEANQGSLSNQSGQWVVKHLFAEECGTQPAKATPAAAEPEFKQNFVKGQPLFDGIYTYETTTAHRTFRLRTQGRDEDFMPGVQILQVLTGPDNTHDYESIGHLVAVGPTNTASLKVWKRHQGKTTLVEHAQAFIADPHGSSVTPAIHCYRCGKTLTVPASVHNGLGPECAKKGL